MFTVVNIFIWAQEICLQELNIGFHVNTSGAPGTVPRGGRNRERGGEGRGGEHSAVWRLGVGFCVLLIPAPTHKVVNRTRTRINHAPVHAISVKLGVIENKVGNLTILCRSRDTAWT